MLHLFAASLALGIAGFDPLGIFALIAAMAIGAKRSGIAVLMGTIVVCTYLFGLIPALTLGPAVGKLSHAMHGVSHTVWGPLVIAAGVALIVWGIVRLVRPASKGGDEQAAAPKSAAPTALALTGVMVALSAFIDPAFYGIIVFAARQSNPLTTAGMLLVWVLASHSALIVVGLATLLGLYQPVRRLIEDFRTKWSKPLAVITSIALIAVGAFCIAEGIAEWHHHWLAFNNLRPAHHRR